MLDSVMTKSSVGCPAVDFVITKSAVACPAVDLVITKSAVGCPMEHSVRNFAFIRLAMMENVNLKL
jgi:hypothetical protein